MQCTRVVAVAGILALATAAGAAAETPQLVSGSRVRVKVSNEQGRLVGTLLALDDSRLQLRIEDEAAPRLFAREDIVDLDVSKGRRSLGRRALYGAVVGAAAGAITVYASSSSSNDDIFTQNEGAGIVAGLFGVAGAFVGMLAIPAEKWRDVPVESVQLSLRPVRGRGAGLFVTVNF